MKVKKHIKFFLVTAVLSVSITSCSSKKKKVATPPITVNVATTTCENIYEYIKTVGHMEAYQTVAIKAQVEGYLEQILFEDGGNINAGDLLYVIDQRPYIQALNKAQGTYDQYLAQMQYAKDTLIRNSGLVKKNYISENNYEKIISDTMATEGLVKQSKAQVEEAKINLGFTKIYAPISARAGFTKVYKGDLITDSSLMLDLNQIAPIYATFFLPGNDLPSIQKYQEIFGCLDVIVKLDRSSDKSMYRGALTFINNKIDLATGMIQLKASFNNDNMRLWPNQYVSIKVLLNPVKNALLIPLACVEKTPKGDRVYVVNDSSQIEMRTVEVGQRQDGEKIHIKKGLKKGESVVTSGQLTLFPGAFVTIKKSKQKNSEGH
ncbi:hypothetical protein COB21_04525 [Candidatus Aerophobetes bacterium]|uniref:Uncharacterized protein n=1 Tax=Aerophobetes bacterium TaxID=2030807 RepID=A0A2A4X116_UNCAE|nr:MAG: hypothetical protein COB21_04525 [Candidatus Aerophobetes bacterium]